ncbi:MAG: hypothetical protein M2R45_01761 [Verrucomicrobia subdivision 3 bacterium]|nr:hypothetical protein [Limisphaerales bacterium]MCS1413498.1 hypothetical protein [Limisphaerales bacterium]
MWVPVRCARANYKPIKRIPMQKIHATLPALAGLVQNIAKRPLALGADILSAVIHPIKTAANGVIFTGKAAGLGVLTGSFMLFGVPLPEAQQAADHNRLPPPPVPVIYWLTGSLEPGRKWNESGFNPPALFDMSLSHSSAPAWTGDCYYWYDRDGLAGHTWWEQWIKGLHYYGHGSFFTVRVEREGDRTRYSGISWAEATWYISLRSDGIPWRDIWVRDSEGNSYRIDMYAYP